MAAVPIENHGRTTCSIVVTPSPSGEIRSPFLTSRFLSVTGDDSLPRSPRPLKPSVISTPFDFVRVKYTTDSSGDAAPGFCADETYESACFAAVTHDFDA